MNVHLILVGTTVEPLIAGIGIYGNVDKAYLLHSDQTLDSAKKVATKLKEFNIEVILRKINIFSVDNMVNSISHIVKNEYGNSVFINITGGTNLMAGAACATSYFVGAQAYYVKDRRQMPPGFAKKDLLIEIPVPNIRYNETLDKNQLEILKLMDKRNGPTNSKLLRLDGLDISPQNLSHHIKTLAHKRLINVKVSEKDTRIKDLTLSEVGKLVLSWSEVK